MGRWYDNPNAVILAKAISERQCLESLPFPPYSDLVLTCSAFAEMVEDLVPNKECRIRALIDIYSATGVEKAKEQIKEYLDKPEGVLS